MVTDKSSKPLIIICILLIYPVSLFPQVKSNQPEEGQAGKNVPWITTPQILVDKMLNLAKITTKDFLIDLGSGDGRLVITAAKQGTRGLGIEYNADLVKLSVNNAVKEGVSGLTEFIKADLFEFDFSKATVITMFLLPEINMRLRPKLLNLKPGTRIVTNTFTMQEWNYDEMVETGDRSNRWNSAYLWIIPAKIDGKWVLSQAGEILFIQEFQMLTGSLTAGGKRNTIEGRLRGNEISFRSGGITYKGTISGNRMNGTFLSGGDVKDWSASR